MNPEKNSEEEVEDVLHIHCVHPGGANRRNEMDNDSDTDKSYQYSGEESSEDDYEDDKEEEDVEDYEIEDRIPDEGEEADKIDQLKEEALIF